MNLFRATQSGPITQTTVFMLSIEELCLETQSYEKSVKASCLHDRRRPNHLVIAPSPGTCPQRMFCRSVASVGSFVASLGSLQ